MAKKPWSYIVMSKHKQKNALRILAQGDEATIWIYGDIGQDGGQISAQYFQEELEALGNIKKLTIRINSSGGAVGEVLAIHAILASHPATVHVEIDGYALSAASLLAMAGHTVSMSENALMMIHGPWTNTGGNAGDLRKNAEALDSVAEQMVNIYAKKTGLKKKRLTEIMEAETWLNASEALALGFIDEIAEAIKVAASFDLSQFDVPARYKENEMTKVKELDAGAITAAALKAEGKRRTDIKALFSPHMAEAHSDILAACLDDMTCTSEMASKQMLDALGKNIEPSGQVVITAGRTDEFKAAATDALLMRYGIPVTDPSPAAADLKNTSLVAMAEACLSMAGKPMRGYNPSKILAAAHSTSDFPYLLSGVASKSLMHGFNNEPASHMAWVRIVDVKDFKEIQRVQRSAAPGLELIPEGGEYEYGSFSERKEVYQVKTYGRMFGITRQALINDDLGAFTDLPQAFGASARRLEADHVYSIVTTNANMADGTALFHADHDNLESSGAAISVSSLGTARTAMRLQTGINGAVLNIIPRFLIVPATLESHAESILAALARPDQSNPGVANAEFIRNLELVVDPRLDANSVTAWYLAGSSSQVDTVELAYLDGQHGLYYEEQPGWNIDALEVKARLDFGTKAVDWRGLYMNPGA